MFGLSLPKILLLVLLVLVAWYGVKWFGRTRRAARSEGKNPLFRFFFRDAPQRPPMVAEDTVRCRTCGTYLPTKTAVSCGRGDCPFPG